MTGIELWETYYGTMQDICGASKVHLDVIWAALNDQRCKEANTLMQNIWIGPLATYLRAARYVPEPEVYVTLGRTNWAEYVAYRKAMRSVREGVADASAKLSGKSE